jgi:hypothetical protein
MAKKAQKKGSAKKAKAKPKPPKATPQRLTAPGWPEEVAHLKAEAEAAAERYWRPWRDPKLIEGRALIDDILKAREPYFRDNPQTQPASTNPPECKLSTKVWLEKARDKHPQEKGELKAPYARRLLRLMPPMPPEDSVSWKTLLRLLFPATQK